MNDMAVCVSVLSVPVWAEQQCLKTHCLARCDLIWPDQSVSDDSVSPSGVTHPGKPALEELAAAASGDVRAAINALQFLCVQTASGKTGRSAWSSQIHRSDSQGEGDHFT